MNLLVAAAILVECFGLVKETNPLSMPRSAAVLATLMGIPTASNLRLMLRAKDVFDAKTTDFGEMSKSPSLVIDAKSIPAATMLHMTELFESFCAMVYVVYPS